MARHNRGIDMNAGGIHLSAGDGRGISITSNGIELMAGGGRGISLRTDGINMTPDARRDKRTNKSTSSSNHGSSSFGAGFDNFFRSDWGDWLTMGFSEWSSGPTSRDIPSSNPQQPKETKQTRNNTDHGSTKQKTSSSSASDDVQAENERLKAERECRICMSEQASMMFLPCGHLATCATCSDHVTDCPLCRQRIQSKHRAYMS